MGLGWRRAFCTSTPKDKDRDTILKDSPNSQTPKLSTRFTGFFSNPSTPRLNRDSSIPSIRCRTVSTLPTTNSAPHSPKLHCKTKTKTTTSFFSHHRSTPSSPRSPSTFPFRLSKQSSSNKCGICEKSVKTGQGTAIFTAECGHSFHFPCIAAHVKKQCTLACPICSSTWKEMHLLNQKDTSSTSTTNPKLKVYNDDEPLSSPTCGARFNTILESDESVEADERDEFPGFFVTDIQQAAVVEEKNLEVSLLSEAAVVSVGKTTETYAVVLRIRAPPAALRRAPIDLVTVLNVSRSVTGEKMQLMKKTMRAVVNSLSATDRLSIVAYSSTSKRLLPLRRMNPSGKRAARRIIDAIVALDVAAGSSSADSIKKAAKVIEDRREVNPGASILLFSDGHRNSSTVSSTRFSNTEIPLHLVSLSACCHAPAEDGNNLAKSVIGLLNVVVQDVRFQLGFKTGSAPAEISAVYSYAGRPAYLGSGSDWFRVGDLYSEEEREMLIELKVPSSYGAAHRVMSVRSSYKDPSTQRAVHDKERPLLVPRPRAVGSSTRDIQRVRCLFVTTRAVAESRRMIERGDVAGAHHMLASARALVLQSGSGLGEEFVRGLEAELAEVNWKRRDPLQQVRSRNNHEREAAVAANEEAKTEPLTPTSAWRAAERLAKVAIMRKSLNRVSDMHGFENARF